MDTFNNCTCQLQKNKPHFTVNYFGCYISCINIFAWDRLIYIKAIEIARLNKIEDALCFTKSDNLICAKKSSNVPKGDMNKYIFKNLHPNPPLDRDIMIAIFPDVILSYYLKILCNRLRFYMCLQHLWSQYSTLKK